MANKHWLTVEVPFELKNEIDRCFPHGFRTQVFRKLTRNILELIAKSGKKPEVVLGRIVSGDISLSQMEKEVTSDAGRPEAESE